MSKRKKKMTTSQLIKDIVYISLVAILFFVIVFKIGGYASDFITKSSCKAVDEKYIEGKKPGEGICVNIHDQIDIKK